LKELLLKYFENIGQSKLNQLYNFEALLLQQNEMHNLISRTDTDNVFIHHILHSLSIAKFIQFKPQSKILDLGTGGGLPGIPLAILFEACEFTLCDSIQKKVTAVAKMAESLNLKNVKCICKRAENLEDKFDFIVTRAVAKTQKLKAWSDSLIAKRCILTHNDFSEWTQTLTF